MTTRKDPDPVDRLLDMAVFAPLGFLLSARELVPEWTERGRRQLEAQLPMARAVGEIAVRQGSKQARATLARLRRQADEILADMRVEKGGSSPPTTSSEAPGGPQPAARAAAPGAGAEAEVDHDENGFGDPDWGGGDRPGPESADLAIPGYDTLSASQVVQRLAGLSREELEAVRAYELAGRARKTVLLRVAQLRAAS